MATHTTSHGTGTTLKAFEGKIVAQLQEAEARIEEFEAKARETRLQAEIAAVNGLKTATQNIERKLKDLATTQDAQIVRSKAAIDAAATSLKTSLDDLGRRFSMLSDDVTRKER